MFVVMVVMLVLNALMGGPLPLERLERRIGRTR
jgi:hypothetical protein